MSGINGHPIQDGDEVTERDAQNMGTQPAPKRHPVKVYWSDYDWHRVYRVLSLTTGRLLQLTPNGHWSHSGRDDGRMLTKADEAMLRRLEHDDNGVALPWDTWVTTEMDSTDMTLFRDAVQRIHG